MAASITGKHEEVLTVDASRYVHLIIEEDGNGNKAEILLFPGQAQELISILQQHIAICKANRAKGDE